VKITPKKLTSVFLTAEHIISFGSVNVKIKFFKLMPSFDVFGSDIK